LVYKSINATPHKSHPRAPALQDRGAFGRMRGAVDIRPWGPFIYGGREEDNFYDNKGPSRRDPLRPYPRVQKPHRWLRGHAQGGAFDSVVGGREGPLPIELYLLHPAFCLCYQKPSPPALSCPSRTRSKASAPACSHAPGFRCQKPLRRAPEAGRLCHDIISRRGRKRRMPKAASRKQTWDAVY
jgi:hypothetical protein